MLDLFTEFEELTRSLIAKQIPFAVCGGIAMAIWGYVRATEDIDLFAPESSVDDVLSVAKERGFALEARPMAFASGLRIRRVSKIAESDLLMLDVLIADASRVDIWNSRSELPWKELMLPVVSKEGMIALKKDRNSDKDRDDIRWLTTNL